MATLTDQLGLAIEIDQERDDGIETLQKILASEQAKPITYNDALELGQSLISFFEAFCGEEVDADVGSN